MVKKEFICHRCGKEFKTYLNGRKTVRYCSVKCSSNDKRKDKNRICKYCGKWFIEKRYKQKFCSHDCYGKSLIGKKQPLISKQGKINISDAKKGKKNPMYGVYGEKHPSWKGGVTEIQNNIRHLFEYNKWRREVFERDNFICQNCGKLGGRIEAHHIKRFSEIIEEKKIKNINDALLCKELWNLNNGKTLCKKCHDKLRGRKK